MEHNPPLAPVRRGLSFGARRIAFTRSSLGGPPNPPFVLPTALMLLGGRFSRP
jgi:hypothetical protein